MNWKKIIGAILKTLEHPKKEISLMDYARAALAILPITMVAVAIELLKAGGQPHFSVFEWIILVFLGFLVADKLTKYYDYFTKNYNIWVMLGGLIFLLGIFKSELFPLGASVFAWGFILGHLYRLVSDIGKHRKKKKEKKA